MFHGLKINHMKRDYFNFKFGNSKKRSLKKLLVSFVLFFSMSLAYGQQTAIITTTSSDSNWTATFTNIGGISLDWQAIGPNGINQSGSGDTVIFDFSANTGVGAGEITITISSDDDFDKVSQFLASSRDITSVEISNLENLVFIELPNNLLPSIDLSTNTNLVALLLSNNLLTSIDLTNNTILESVELHINSLTSLDLSTNLLLKELDANNNDLTSINLLNNSNLEILDLDSNDLTSIDLSNNSSLRIIDLNFNLLDTATIGMVLDEVDAYGTSGFLLKLQGNPGTIPASSADSYENLLDRGWTVLPPIFYDFGDAPDSYGTLLSSGGAQHIIGVTDVKIGIIVDDEALGFPSVNADGDDVNPPNAANDEDGVAAADLNGISTSTDTFDLNVNVTNNTVSGAFLYGWIDFDRSGTFDSDEYATVAAPIGGVSTVVLNWTGIQAAGITEGSTYARFRISTDVIPSTQPAGISNNGEVEDYALVIELDFDEDGIPDSADVDDDNDGILDVDEAGNTDPGTNEDRINLDSDGDGCFDVAEDLTTDVIDPDPDGDGILGTSPVTVDANGQVTSGTDGYTPPNDLNSSGTRISRTIIRKPSFSYIKTTIAVSIQIKGIRIR